MTRGGIVRNRRHGRDDGRQHAWFMAMLAAVRESSLASDFRITEALRMGPSSDQQSALYWEAIGPIQQLQAYADPHVFPRHRGFQVERGPNFDAVHSTDDSVMLFSIAEYQDIAPFRGTLTQRSIEHSAFCLYGHAWMGIHRGVFIDKVNGHGKFLPANGYTKAELRDLTEDEAWPLAVILNVGDKLPEGAPSNIGIIWTRYYRYTKYIVVHCDKIWPVEYTDKLAVLSGTITTESRKKICHEIAHYEKAAAIRRSVDSEDFPDQPAPPFFSKITSPSGLGERGMYFYNPPSKLPISTSCTTTKSRASLEFPSKDDDKAAWEHYETQLQAAASSENVAETVSQSGDTQASSTALGSTTSVGQDHASQLQAQSSAKSADAVIRPPSHVDRTQSSVGSGALTPSEDHMNGSSQLSAIIDLEKTPAGADTTLTSAVNGIEFRGDAGKDHQERSLTPSSAPEGTSRIDSFIHEASNCGEAYTGENVTARHDSDTEAMLRNAYAHHRDGSSPPHANKEDDASTDSFAQLDGFTADADC